MGERTPGHAKAIWAGAAIVLLAQALMMRAMTRAPVIAPPRSLNQFPLQIGEWTSTAPASIEKEAQPVGGADAVLVRNYRSQTCGCSMSLQITYYRTQAEMHQQYDFGEYLPEEGWSRISSKLIRLLPAGGQSAAIRYDVVARGSERRALLRWFETRRGAMVNSERLHLYRIWDAMFHRPSDLARVQIVAAGEKKRAELVSPNAIAFAQRVMEEITSLLFRPRRVT